VHALSLAVMAIISAGVRVAIAMPAAPGAAWFVPAAGPSPREIRSGTWRAMFVIAVAPVAVLSASLYTLLWSPAVAAAHLVTLVCAGALIIEVLLWNHDAMPHTEPWRPDRAAMGKRWPLYIGGFTAFAIGIGWMEAGALAYSLWFIPFVGTLVALALVARRSHVDRWLVTPRGDEDPAAAITLDLQ
jgi:hypothetical protein